MAREHYIRCKTAFDGQPEWVCVSLWDTPAGRLRVEHARRTWYRTLEQAQRWARRYKVDCPTVPEPPHPGALVAAEWARR